MARVLIHRELVVRIANHGLTKELRAFVIACQNNEQRLPMSRLPGR
jgi:hypothetical protein